MTVVARAADARGGEDPRPRVLVEEPNGDLRELIVTLLGRLGCAAVVRPLLGDAALDGLDLIVAEPASAGGQRILAEHARRQSRIPIVCVSIYPRERTRLPRAASAYLVKPFSGCAFERCVRAMLEPL
jgi:CheY-like chemotaxis protein